MTTHTCHTCKHFIQQLSDRNTAQGTCRCHPPGIVLLNTPRGPQPASIFPAVKIGESCGEHKVKIFEASSIPAENPQ